MANQAPVEFDIVFPDDIEPDFFIVFFFILWDFIVPDFIEPDFIEPEVMLPEVMLPELMLDWASTGVAMRAAAAAPITKSLVIVEVLVMAALSRLARTFGPSPGGGKTT